MRATRAGWARTLSPTTKNAAGTFFVRRTSSTRGVDSGSGPSSNVSATKAALLSARHSVCAQKLELTLNTMNASRAIQDASTASAPSHAPSPWPNTRIAIAASTPGILISSDLITNRSRLSPELVKVEPVVGREAHEVLEPRGESLCVTLQRAIPIVAWQCGLFFERLAEQVVAIRPAVDSGSHTKEALQNLSYDIGSSRDIGLC